MNTTKINEIQKYVGKEVLLKGWLHEIKAQKKMLFLLLRDYTGIIQIVADRDSFPDIASLHKETVVSIEGVVQKATITNEQVTQNSAEVFAKKITVLSKVVEELPLDLQNTQLPTKLDWRCLSLRDPKSQAIMKIQAALLEGMQNALKDFQQVFTPCLMGVPSESGSEMFALEYFGKTAYLRQDPQLHRQLAIAAGIEKLYDLGPVWRAEQSHTTRHLCEHRVCAVELAFIKDETDTMDVEENVIIGALTKAKECKRELELLGVDISIPKKPFPVLQFPEVYDILEQKGKHIRGEDLDTEAEKILGEYVKEKYGYDFYFVNRFPYAIKPFYVMKENETYARSVDLMFKGIELSSGGQREHRYEELIKQVKEKDMDPKLVEWFTKFFKYGVPPHGGFAIGIERLTMTLLGIKNIREAVLFPRDPKRMRP